jgi:hypothetical protein
MAFVLEVSEKDKKKKKKIEKVSMTRQLRQSLSLSCFISFTRMWEDLFRLGEKTLECKESPCQLADEYSSRCMPDTREYTHVGTPTYSSSRFSVIM